MSPPTCPYCGVPSEPTTGDRVYPHSPALKDKVFWVCRGCDAWVGTHERTGKPLGTLANQELRLLRRQAHSAFDPLWKTGKRSRSQAYRWLSGKLGIPFDQTHIAMFDGELCRKTIEAAEKFCGER